MDLIKYERYKNKKISPDLASATNRLCFAECTAIGNCDQEVCTTNTDQTCELCNGQYEALLGNAYYPSADARTCVSK